MLMINTYISYIIGPVTARGVDYLVGGRSTPLSLSAPLGSGEHDVTRWIDGLLPDSLQVRRKWADRAGARSAGAMDLLGTPIGLDCAGAVQFCRPGDEESRRRRSSGLEPQGESDVAGWIRRVRRDWSDWSGIGSSGRFSLAGAQPKCALHWDGHQWCVPHGDTPTTHILKPRASSQPSAWAAAAGALRLDAGAVIDRAAEITRGTPSAISDAIDGLSDEDRASRALPLLHSLSRRLAIRAAASLVQPGAY